MRGVGRGFGGKLVDEEGGGSIDAKGWAPKKWVQIGRQPRLGLASGIRQLHPSCRRTLVQKYQVLSKFGTKQEIRQCLFLFCSCSNVFVAPVLKSKRLFCVVRKREGLGSQHFSGKSGGLVGGGWASSISSSATSHDIPVQTTNSDSRVWTQRPGKTFWLQNFNNNRIACVEKLSVKSGWGKGKRPTMPLQLSN